MPRARWGMFVAHFEHITHMFTIDRCYIISWQIASKIFILEVARLCLLGHPLGSTASCGPLTAPIRYLSFRRPPSRPPNRPQSFTVQFFGAIDRKIPPRPLPALPCGRLHSPRAGEGERVQRLLKIQAIAAVGPRSVFGSIRLWRKPYILLHPRVGSPRQLQPDSAEGA